VSRGERLTGLRRKAALRAFTGFGLLEEIDTDGTADHGDICGHNPPRLILILKPVRTPAALSRRYPGGPEPPPSESPVRMRFDFMPTPFFALFAGDLAFLALLGFFLALTRFIDTPHSELGTLTD
jgi:hypothetical protein